MPKDAEDAIHAAIEADRKRGTAKQRYDSAMEGSTEADPVERLRFYCSLALSGQDWLDVVPFFDALIADRQQRGEASGYAYRYSSHDGGTVIRFNNGGEVNGSRPIEALPYWFTPQPAEPVKCQDPSMGEHACSNRAQCWEPCGELGKSIDHAKVAEPVKVPSDAEVVAALTHARLALERYVKEGKLVPAMVLSEIRALLARYTNQENSNGGT